MNRRLVRGSGVRFGPGRPLNDPTSIMTVMRMNHKFKTHPRANGTVLVNYNGFVFFWSRKTAIVFCGLQNPLELGLMFCCAYLRVGAGFWMCKYLCEGRYHAELISSIKSIGLKAGIRFLIIAHKSKGC